MMQMMMMAVQLTANNKQNNAAQGCWIDQLTVSECTVSRFGTDSVSMLSGSALQ
jgi:hypothetical protein